MSDALFMGAPDCASSFRSEFRLRAFRRERPHLSFSLLEPLLRQIFLLTADAHIVICVRAHGDSQRLCGRVLSMACPGFLTVPQGGVSAPPAQENTAV